MTLLLAATAVACTAFLQLITHFAQAYHVSDIAVTNRLCAAAVVRGTAAVHRLFLPSTASIVGRSTMVGAVHGRARGQSTVPGSTTITTTTNTATLVSVQATAFQVDSCLGTKVANNERHCCRSPAICWAMRCVKSDWSRLAGHVGQLSPSAGPSRTVLCCLLLHTAVVPGGSVTIANGSFTCPKIASGQACVGKCDTDYSGAPLATCTNGLYDVTGSCEPGEALWREMLLSPQLALCAMHQWGYECTHWWPVFHIHHPFN